MYKIYINNTPLFLRSQEEMDFPLKADPDEMVARYTGKAKFFLAYADMLEKSTRFKSVTLYSKDYEKMVADFFSNYKLIEAAGGVVFDPDGKLLVIYRQGSWDLPKGKIDKGESPAEAALREVEEETGMQGLQLGEALLETYHTYRHRRHGRILKRTYWFLMSGPHQQLKPQAEEDIEIAEWVEPGPFLQEPKELYGNIKDLLKLVEERGNLNQTKT